MFLMVMIVALFASANACHDVRRDGASWGYPNHKNSASVQLPNRWKDGFPACGGVRQSPIDIQTANVVNERMEPFWVNYPNQLWNIDIVNNGYNIGTKSAIPNTLNISGLDFGNDVYQLHSFHFHWSTGTNIGGSEHTVNGKQAAFELHLVHFNTKYETISNAIGQSDGLAVLGVFVDISSRDNPAFNPIFNAIKDGQLDLEKTTKPVTGLNLQYLLAPVLANLNVWRYSGSLTNPGCNEVVSWIVAQERISISSRQLRALQVIKAEANDLIAPNWRPTQPLNGRVVRSNNPVFTFSGVVRDNSFAGIAGASIVVVDTNLSAWTDANGFFLFNNALWQRSSPYKVVITKGALSKTIQITAATGRFVDIGLP